jgi:hypothetical protein
MGSYEQAMDVGKILLHALGELKSIRGTLRADDVGESDGTVALDAALAQAEYSLRDKAEQLSEVCGREQCSCPGSEGGAASVGWDRATSTDCATRRSSSPRCVGESSARAQGQREEQRPWGGIELPVLTARQGGAALRGVWERAVLVPRVRGRSSVRGVG